MAQINLKVLTNIQQSEKQLEALKSSVESISKSLSSVSVNPKLTAQITALTKHYNAVAKAAEKVAKVNYHNEIEAQKLAKATAQANKAIADETTAIEKSKTQFAKHQKAVNDDARAQEKHEAQMKKSTEQVKKSAKETEKHSQSIVSMIPNIIKWQVAMTAVMFPLRKLQEGLDSINETLVETEKRVVSLRRVAGQAANANELYDLAEKYGQTFDNVADVVENLVKSGYTWEESLKAAEPALLAINVAELDATQATEGLVAVVKQYGMELEDLNYIQGVLNKTADNAAVTTEKLLIALQKTGSTAKNANIDFEETVGLITALSEGTAASGQNIGNALRSLIVFTSDSKALDSFARLSSGMAETVKNYRAGQASILDIWKGLGGELQVMNSQKGTLEDLFGGAELSADIEAQLTQITDSFAEIYGTAGNYRQNYFIALLDNIKKVEDATKELGDATTYSQKENEKYLDTYEAKVNALDAKWKELANDEQGFLAFKKGMIDVASDLLTAVDAVGGIGGLLNATTAILTPFLLKWTITFGASAISAAKSGIVSFFTAMKTGALSANAALGLIGVALGGISLAISAAQANTEKWHESNQKAIRDWESIKAETAALDALYNEYQQLTPEAKEYAEIEKELVTALGEKAVALEDLTKGTNDYREAVKKLAEEELRAAEQKYTLAQKAASEELGSYKFLPFAEQASRLSGSADKAAEVLRNVGVGFDFTPSFGGGRKISLDTRNSGSVEDQLYNYDLYVSASEKVWNEYKKALLNGDDEYVAKVIDVYESLSAKIEDAKPYVENYRNTTDSLNFVLEKLQDIEEETEKTEETTENLATNLSKLDSDVLSSIADKFKEIRDATQEAYDFEEKKKAVLEAEQALADAYNEREVRIYNAQTGRWEMKSRQADIQKAQENLDKARLDAENSAYNEIIKDLESGNTTNEAILAIIAKWEGAYGNGDFSHVSDSVKKVLSEFGVDLTNSKAEEKSEVTDKPDTIPEMIEKLNKKIFEEVSDEEFAKNVKEKQLLFGTSKSIASAVGNLIYNNPRTNNDSHNVIMNGITIPRDVAQGHSIMDIFSLIPLLGD